ncbi:MAG: hypothetical protein JF603_06925 [Acidobacteria bacterium]|nr:hypothetical protein [Acidobacteriota bacterium]
MHPIERLRYVARVGGVDQGELIREASAALGGFGSDTGGLIVSCRRLLDRHPSAGALWTLCARLLTTGDLAGEAWRVSEEIDGDKTVGHVARLIPDDATLTVVGWPELVALALPKRGDVEVLCIDASGDGTHLSRRLRGADVEADDVPDAGVGAAAAASDLVLLEANCSGPDGFIAPAGSYAAAAVAHHAGVPVWVVVGAGRALPQKLWEVAVTRLRRDEPWEAAEEVVPLDLADRYIGPTGGGPATDLATRSDCSPVPELLEHH